MPAYPPIHKMIAESDVAWTAFCIERDLKPLPEQFALAPGDKAIAMAGDSLIDRNVALIEIEDPEAYAERYPDYETRALNSYVLTRYWSPEETSQVGWFARCRLIPLSVEEYDELTPYFLEHKEAKPEPPDWLRDRWQTMMDIQSDVDPGLMPKHVECPECHGRDVHIHAEMSIKSGPHAGEITKDGKTIYSPVQRPEWDTTIEVHLHCMSCHSQAQLTPEELDDNFTFPTMV